MSQLPQITSHHLLSFDVYGTLIDWNAGLLTALKPLLSANNKTSLSNDTIWAAYGEVEAAQQKKTPNMKYSELLTTIHPILAEKLGCKRPSEEESRQFGASVGSWPTFPDTLSTLHRLRAAGFKLVVLSNVDNASFANTISGPLEGFEFDAVLTAEDIGSYKPDLRNFEYMLRFVREEWGIEKEEVLQVAQSQVHDQRPCREVGVRGCWIDRYGESEEGVEGKVFDWRFGSLGEMADAVERELAESKK